MLLLAPAALRGQDTTAVARDSAAVQPDTTLVTDVEVEADTAALVELPDSAVSARRYPGPTGSFLRSFVLPGWGQLRLGRKVTAGLFVLAEGAFLTMSLRTNAELQDLRRAGADSAAIDLKTQSREDWLVLLGFNHLLAGLEAYVSAHLADFPDDLHIRAVPGGVAGTVSVPFRLR